MVDKILEFLQTVLGKTVLGLVVFFVLGVVAFAYWDSCVCTENEKKLIYVAMDNGDDWNRLDVIQWKLDTAKTEKIRLENFIEINQRGEMTKSQEVRLKELTTQILNYNSKKQQLLKKLQAREKN